MTNYGKPRTAPTAALKSKEERKKILEAVRRRRAAMYTRLYQKQQLESKH